MSDQHCVSLSWDKCQKNISGIKGKQRLKLRDPLMFYLRERYVVCSVRNEVCAACVGCCVLVRCFMTLDQIHFDRETWVI